MVNCLWADIFGEIYLKLILSLFCLKPAYLESPLVAILIRVKLGANVHKRDKKELEAFIQLHISFITREVSRFSSYQTYPRVIIFSFETRKLYSSTKSF